MSAKKIGLYFVTMVILKTLLPYGQPDLALAQEEPKIEDLKTGQAPLKLQVKEADTANLISVKADLESQLRQMKDRRNTLKKRFNELRQSLNDKKLTLDDKRKEINRFQKDLTKAETEKAALGDIITQLPSRLRALKDELAKALDIHKRTLEEINQTAISIDSLQKRVDEFSRSLGEEEQDREKAAELKSKVELRLLGDEAP